MASTGGVFWGVDETKKVDLLNKEVLAFSTPFLFEENVKVKRRKETDEKQKVSKAQEEMAALMVGSHRDEVQHLEAEIAAEEAKAAEDKKAALIKAAEQNDVRKKDLKAFNFGSTLNVGEGEEHALMATLRALIKIVRKRVLTNDGLPDSVQSMFTAPYGNCDGRYYSSEVKQEDKDYFMAEMERLEAATGSQDKNRMKQVGWLKKMHYRGANEKALNGTSDGYAFDRSYVSHKKQKNTKKLRPEFGVTGQIDRLAKPAGASMHSHVGWKDIRARHEIPSSSSKQNNEVAQSKALEKALKAGQDGNWVELQAGGLENQRKQFEHLLHILQQQLVAEIQRHSDLNSVSLEDQRKRYHAHMRITKERAEASDKIVRILKKYGMLSALEEASYLTATCKSLLDTQNPQYAGEGGPTYTVQRSKSAPDGLLAQTEIGRERDRVLVRELEGSLSRTAAQRRQRERRAKARRKQKERRREIPGHVHQGRDGTATKQYTLPAVKHDIFEQRRRRKQGIGLHHTGQHSLLKSHAATEILWKLDEKDQEDVSVSGRYDAGRLGGKGLFMQLTNLAPDANKAYSFSMSQQLDAFTNFGNQNPSTLPPKVPSPPPGSPAVTPRVAESAFKHAPGYYPDGQMIRFDRL